MPQAPEPTRLPLDLSEETWIVPGVTALRTWPGDCVRDRENE